MAPVKNSGKSTEDVEVSVAEVVDFMRLTGEFSTALSRVVERKLALAAARKGKIRVTNAELQRTADAFRAVNGLHKAKDTNLWLKAKGLSLEALEDYLEANVLISKFKDRLAKEAPKKVQNSDEVKAAVREAAYRDWLGSAMG